MPAKHPLKAPPVGADVKDHKRHAEEFLKLDRYKQKPTHPDYREANDEAKE